MSHAVDEAGRRRKPAYDLKDRWLRGEVDPKTPALGAARARAELEAAPVGELLETYARRVRSRGELDVLGSLNQKLWLEWKESERFLAAVEIEGTRKWTRP